MLEKLRLVEIAFNRLDADKYPEVAEDITTQVSSLIYPQFLTMVGSDRLPDLHRYLEAIERRLERLPRDPARDAIHMGRIHALEHELDRLQEAMPGEDRLMEAAWLIQELRVSFFAQAIGTRGKVSEKRVRSLLTEIEMG